MNAHGGYYDRQGRPITAEDYARFMEGTTYLRVAETRGGALRVSTVWLGIDHRFNDKGAPLIFETMVFRGDGYDALEEHTRRYSTEEAARIGHREVCNAVLGP